jgi:tetratricopeptide (TPR) repeat protein
MGGRKVKKLPVKLPSRIHRKKKFMNPECLGNAIALHQAGRLQEAEVIYQSILQQQPDNPDALHLLGVIAFQVGKNDIAATLIAQAVAIKPDFAEAHNNLGNALIRLGKYDQALKCYQLTLKLKPNYPEVHASIGNYYKIKNQHDVAISHYEKALSLNPEYAEAHNNLGITLEETNCRKEAIEHYTKALSLNPNYAEAHNNLGNSLRGNEKFKDAIEHFEKALNINSNYIEAYLNLGDVFKIIGQYDDAIAHFTKALCLNPNYAEAYNNLGAVYQDINKVDEAIVHYEKAIKLKPEYAEAYNNLGVIYQEIGQKSKAVSLYKKTLNLKPDSAETLSNLTFIEPNKDDINTIETILKSSLKSNEETMHLHYALGNLHNKYESYADAFEHFYAANKLKRKSIAYKPEEHSNYIDKLIQLFTQDYFDKQLTEGNSSETPVFIVGMPRSGTTLVEQIISSHPLASGAGELTAFTQFEADISKLYQPADSYPECMSSCNNSTIQSFANTYLNELKMFSENAVRITDKMPNNFLRIGLIKTIFPNARIIHCQRNALDTCLSIYTNYFVKGNKYTFDLTDLGLYYQDYLRLMDHWHEVFGSQIFDIQYEALVMNQKKLSKQLIDYVDLDWDEECINFHKNKRTVKTASNLQVREPMYSRSIDRWKNYEKQLEPLRTILNV